MLDRILPAIRRAFPGKKNAEWGTARKEEYDFSLIGMVFDKSSHDGAMQAVSQRTMNDIDFQRLFPRLDRTVSRVGQQYLYDRLLVLDKNPDFEAFENLAGRLGSDEQLRGAAIRALSALDDRKSYQVARLFLDAYPEKPGLFFLIPVLSFISAATLAASFLYLPFILCFIGVQLANFIVHAAMRKYALLYSDSISRLITLRNSVKRLLKLNLNAGGAKDARRALAVTDRVRYHLPVFAVGQGSDANMLNALAGAAAEYVKICFLIEPMVVFSALRRLEEARADIRALFDYAGHIDTALSVASLRREDARTCVPVIRDSGRELSFIDLHHPLVPSCVPNSLDTLGNPVLLTGSNMSGKSTFIRALAINTLLAQTIHTCFARAFTLTRCRIYTAVRISDSVETGKSYYFEEVETVREMIEASRGETRNIFFLDELFKGTNAVERIAAGKAVLSYLSETGNAVFVSTHDLELTGLLKDTYALHHFTETIQDGQVCFDYRLKSGSLATRNAIRILVLNGYPEQVIREAEALANAGASPGLNVS